MPFARASRSMASQICAQLNMTRTPDCHFAAEARHNGSKMWVFAPDFNQVAKYADEWISINAGLLFNAFTATNAFAAAPKPTSQTVNRSDA